MSKFYAQWRRPRPPARKWRVHPIWRGIGCLMLVLIPIFSFGVAGLLMEANVEQGWVAIPRDLLGPPGMPVENLYVRLITTALLTVVLFGAYTVIYMFIYGLMGPPRYGPLDARPVRRKRTQKRPRAGRR